MLNKSVKFIDQKYNFKNNFGSVYRSSAIFYIPKNIKTSICISNYWKFKNNIKVGIVVTSRHLNGKLISREEKNFENSNVLIINNPGTIEGSVEIEAFSDKNLRIPYAAVMAVYEGNKSINMVHTYARNHSIMELEENNAITEGKESCWTIKPNLDNRAIFHNGHIEIKKQKAKVILNNQEGEEIIRNFPIPNLKSFETFVFDIKKIFPNYKKFFSNKDGIAKIHFKNNSSFPRLLLVWSKNDNNEFQTTHANFDYSKYVTNKVKTSKGGEMTIPKLPDVVKNLKLVVYPKFEKGKYFVKFDDLKQEPFNRGFIRNIDSKVKKITFFTKNNYLPSRIVTGISGKGQNQIVPFECSLGINHIEARKKRFGWALVSGQHTNFVLINKISLIESALSKEFVFRLYNCQNKKVLEKKKDLSLHDESRLSVDLKEIFPKYKNFLKNNYGYISIFNTDTSIRFYTSISDSQKGVMLEHAF